jgi:PAS domain S-box-containing protein
MLLQLLDYSTSVVFLFLAIYILLRDPRSPLNRAFFWLLGSFFIWSVPLFFVHDPYAAIGNVDLFYKISPIGWASFPGLSLFCAVVLSENKVFNRFKLLSFIPIPLFIYLRWAGYLGGGYVLQSWGWAFVWGHSFWVFLFYFYFSVFMSAAFYLLYFLRQKGENKVIRGQASIMLFTGLISCFLASNTDIVLPLFRIYFIPNIGPSCILIFAFGIIYAITRFQFALSEQEIRAEAKKEVQEAKEYASAIVDSSADAIIGKTLDGTVTSWNNGAKLIYGYRPDEIIGKNISILAPKELATEIDMVLKKISKGGKIEHFETKRMRKDGSRIFVAITVSPIINAAGKVTGASTIARDITERKNAEQALKESEDKYRAIADQSFVGIAISKGKQIIYVNNALLQIFNYDDIDEFLKIPLLDHVAPSSRKMVEDRLRIAAEGKTLRSEFDYEVIAKGGQIKTLHIANVHISMGGEKVSHSSFLDITERKMAEERLKENEEKYRVLIENAGETILVAQDERVKFINGNSFDLLGYRPEELVGKPFIDFIHKDDRKLVGERYARRLKGEEPSNKYSFRVINRTGEIKWVQISAVRIDWRGKPATLNFLTDITESKLSEIALKASETRYRTLFESSNDILVQIDTSMKLTDINKRAEEISGYKKEELVGKSIGTLADKFTPLSLAAMIANFAKRKLGFQVRPYEVEAFDTHRNKLSFEISAVPIKDGAGKDIGEMAVLHDITERKKAGQELMVKSALLEVQSEASLDGTLMVDKNGEILSFNNRFIEILGVPPRIIESRSRDGYLNFVKDMCVDPEEFLKKVQYLSEHRNEKSRDEIDLKDGRCLDRYSAPTFDADGKYDGRVWYFRDITESKKLDRMKDDFVAMVSHELRTPLTVIQGILANFLDGIVGEFSEKQKHYLVAMYDDVLRLSRIIKEILNLSKLEAGAMELHRSDTDIEDMAKKCVDELAEQAARKKISVSVKSAQKPPRLNIDPDKIAEVFINLINNAIKCTPEGGKITVRISGTKELTEVSITDTGIGIAEDQIPHLFSKFFQIGRIQGPGPKGTGLGLAICREIIQLHGGRIWAESGPGKGSTFTFTLPHVPGNQK